MNPGDPDVSYLLMKIEYAPGIEVGQMPLNETPLPQASIDAIGQWIATAPSVPVTAAAACMFEVTDTFPADRATLERPKQSMVTLTGEVDATRVDSTTVSLDRLADAVDTAVPIDRKVVLANLAVLIVTPRMTLRRGLTGSRCAAVAAASSPRSMSGCRYWTAPLLTSQVAQ